jgi:hypothetical protein
MPISDCFYCHVLVHTVLQSQVYELQTSSRRYHTLEKVRQMENLLFTLGNGSQICAVLEEFGDRPLVREALGRRCRKNELIKDVAVREKMTDNLASFMEALKTFGNRRKEDDNAMRVITTAVCSGDMLEEKEISAVARVTGMRWEFVKQCCEHRVLYDAEDTDGNCLLDDGWTKVKRGSNKTEMSEVVNW